MVYIDILTMGTLGLILFKDLPFKCFEEHLKVVVHSTLTNVAQKDRSWQNLCFVFNPTIKLTGK